MKNESISVTFRFDAQSQYGAIYQHRWYRWKFWILLRSAICLLAMLAGGYLIVTRGQHVLAAFLVSGGAVGLLRPMIWQMWSERSLRKHPAYGQEVTYVFDERGIEITGSAGNASLAWHDIESVVPCRRGTLFYTDKNDYLWVPNSELSQKEERSKVLEMASK